MARGDVRHSGRRVDRSARRSARTGSGRLLRRATAALVVLVLVLAGVSYTFDLGTRWLGWDYPSPVTEPAAVAPPPGLTLPAPTVAEPVAVPGDASTAADPAKVRRALAGLLRDKKLGPRVAVAVDQLSDGSPVFRSGPSVVTPASTMKLLTSTAALASLGQGHTFSTTVVAGATPRQVVLVGGGDPLLARTPSGDDTYPARADLLTLAKKTARSLDGLGRTRVSLGYDASLFTGPAVSPQWPASYLPDDVVSPISALWVDEGRERPGMVDRSADPALGAAQVFAQALAKQGIAVVGRPRPTAADAEPDVLAEVESAPLEQVVQWVLEMSDNEGAEVLFRHVALATDRPGSFVGGSAAVRDVLADLGIETAGQRILDGSGLSRDDRVAAGDAPRGGRRGRGRGPPRAAPGRGRPPRRGLHRLADLPVRHRRRRRPGPGPGEDRHADRRARAGRDHDRPRRHRAVLRRWSPTGSRWRTRWTPGPRSTRSPPPWRAAPAEPDRPRVLSARRRVEPWLATAPR